MSCVFFVFLFTLHYFLKILYKELRERDQEIMKRDTTIGTLQQEHEITLSKLTLLEGKTPPRNL